jgi:CheY-like chemotaxis protein
VDACDRSGTIIIRARPDGDLILLEVSDDGHGMTEDVLERCLDPFFTTKKDRGTGLGLPMVHSIVKRHGGQISIQSAPGQGTTISVRLPRAWPRNGVAEPLPEQRFSDPWRVLVVDDEEHVRTVLHGYLVHGGHTAVCVGTADEALAAIASSDLDVVLLDRAMPDMSGDQLAVLIRQARPQVRILMLSGFGAAHGANGTIPPVDGFLAKPVRLDQLMTVIGQVMDRPASSAPVPSAPRSDAGPSSSS